MLKDASSTAIYGSRGSNGIVLVTTKSGKAGKVTVNYNAYVGFKKAEDNPWEIFRSKYAVGDVVKATIVSITSFGAFAQIIDGVDGLIHISQIADKKVENVKDILSVGDEVDVKIIDIDEESKRISISMRALLEDAADEEAEEAPAEDAE